MGRIARIFLTDKKTLKSGIELRLYKREWTDKLFLFGNVFFDPQTGDFFSNRHLPNWIFNERRSNLKNYRGRLAFERMVYQDRLIEFENEKTAKEIFESYE